VLKANQTVPLAWPSCRGLYLFSRLGAAPTFASLMPGFAVFGAGAGLMNVPLTNAVLNSMPPERSGIASALLNASREVAGLLGITIIGAVLRSQQGSASGAACTRRGLPRRLSRGPDGDGCPDRRRAVASYFALRVITRSPGGEPVLVAASGRKPAASGSAEPELASK